MAQETESSQNNENKWMRVNRVLPIFRAFRASLALRAFGANWAFRTFRAFQALNMLMQPVGLRLWADPDGKGAGFKGGAWKVKHVKNGWALDFEDGMKLSAFPNRDWKRILPLLEAKLQAQSECHFLPQSRSPGRLFQSTEKFFLE